MKEDCAKIAHTAENGKVFEPARQLARSHPTSCWRQPESRDYRGLGMAWTSVFTGVTVKMECFHTFYKSVIADNATTDEWLETASTTEESTVVEEESKRKNRGRVRVCDFSADGSKRIADNALVAMTLLIAESRREEKDVLTRVLVNLINRRNQ